MSASVMQMVDGKSIVVKDRLVKKNITTDAAMKKLLSTVTLELQRQGSGLKNQQKIQQELEKALSDYGEKLEHDLTRKDAPFITKIEIDGKQIVLDLNKLNCEKIAKETEEALRFGKLEINTEDHNSLQVVLNAHPVIAKYLIPKLEALYPNAKFLIQTNDNYTVMGAAALVQQAKFGISTCDLLPYNLGLSLYNGTMKTLIDGKTNYPAHGGTVFQTINDNQKSIRAIIYEGDRVLARNCKPIGELHVKDLPPSPCGTKYELTLELDQNGVLTGYGRDVITKKKIDAIVNQKVNIVFLATNNPKNSKGLVLDSSAETDSDKTLFEMLDTLDIYMEYLFTMSKNLEEEKRKDVFLKLTRARSYINMNKLKITAQEVEQIKLELNECADMNNIQRRKSLAHTAEQVFSNGKTNSTKENGKLSSLSKTCIIS